LSKELTKEKLAEIMEPLLERFQVPIKRALSETGLSGSDFYAVEIVGGSMRIPAFKVAAAQAAGVYKDDPNLLYYHQNFVYKPNLTSLTPYNTLLRSHGKRKRVTNCPS